MKQKRNGCCHLTQKDLDQIFIKFRRFGGALEKIIAKKYRPPLYDFLCEHILSSQSFPNKTRYSQQNGSIDRNISKSNNSVECEDILY
jgi:hypothetical protein